MNINEIITELKQNHFFENIPEGYNVRSREYEYSNYIQQINPIKLPQNLYNFEEFILIDNGDIEFPEIEISDIKGKINEEGIEALAWYRSFHWNPPEKWGIYILEKGIYYIAQTTFSIIKKISKSGRPFNTLDFIQQGFKLLFLHEFFHFITDIAAVLLEMGNSLRHRNYAPYIENVYMKPNYPNEPMEEALANAFAFKKFRSAKIRMQLRGFMRTQPSGYSAFEEHLTKKQFLIGRRELGTSIRNGNSRNKYIPLETLFNSYPHDLNFSDVPIYIVQTIRDPKYIIRFIDTIKRSEIVESDNFKRNWKRLRLPIRIIKKYQKALEMLEFNAHHSGLRLKKIKGCDNVFTFRVDDNYRVSLKNENGQWILLKIGKHDQVNNNPGGC